LSGCAAEEGALEAQTPLAERTRNFTYGVQRAADQPSVALALQPPPATPQAPIYPLEGYSTPPPRRTISLGFIGDEPLGRFDGGGVTNEPWWRPFPPHWEASFHSPRPYARPGPWGYGGYPYR
jgi:hypothetical protein